MLRGRDVWPAQPRPRPTQGYARAAVLPEFSLAKMGCAAPDRVIETPIPSSWIRCPAGRTYCGACLAAEARESVPGSLRRGRLRRAGPAGTTATIY